MKAVKYLLILLAVSFVLPFSVLADEEEAVTTSTQTDDRIHVYFFRGEGCSHCAEAEAYFASIQEEYGSLFKIIDFETWYNEDNDKLMKKVAETRNESAEGVPYIVIGNMSWNGFTEDLGAEMLAQIKAEHEKEPDQRFDLADTIPELIGVQPEKGSDVGPLLIVLAVTCAICYGVYKAREANK